VQPPDTQYVRRPDGGRIAYQVVGAGPVDVLFAPAVVSHLDFHWADPAFVRFIERLSGFARVVLFDKPGTGSRTRSRMCRRWRSERETSRSYLTLQGQTGRR
jgi:hypothetical protein